MKTSDNSKVICPNCKHEFRAIPADVQTERKSLQTRIEILREQIIDLGGRLDD